MQSCPMGVGTNRISWQWHALPVQISVKRIYGFDKDKSAAQIRWPLRRLSNVFTSVFMIAWPNGAGL